MPWYTVPPMRKTPSARPKKDQQMNVRFTADEISTLNAIAELEDRDKCYLVGFFVRWGIEQYSRIGSLMLMRKKHFEHDPRLSPFNLQTLQRLKIEPQETNGATSKKNEETT